jgi:hypothetical protein
MTNIAAAAVVVGDDDYDYAMIKFVNLGSKLS